jgi:glycosyltransferase involved in cell wall biosynthesis
MQKKTLLIVTSSFPRWPNDTDPPFVYELARRITGPFKIIVLAPHCEGARAFERLDGLDVYRFRYFFPKFQQLAYYGGILNNLRRKPWLYAVVPFFIFFQLSATLRLICKYRPAVIHAHWIIPQGLIAAIACRLTKHRPRLICTAHGGDVYGLKGPMMRCLRRFILSRASLCTVVSEAMRHEVLRQLEKPVRIAVVPMGVDLKQRFIPGRIRRHEKQLLFAGRLVAKKGVEFLLQAMPRIRQAHPDVSLLIVGHGPEKDRLANMTRELQIDARVEFRGGVPNDELPRYYQSSSIVIFPSVVDPQGDREGFGLVLVEALGCACAAVISDLPAMRDIVTDGRTGVIVPQKDPKAIAEQVIELLDQPRRARELGRAGRQYVLERFDWDRIAQRYEELMASAYADRV